MDGMTVLILLGLTSSGGIIGYGMGYLFGFRAAHFKGIKKVVMVRSETLESVISAQKRSKPSDVLSDDVLE